MLDTDMLGDPQVSVRKESLMRGHGIRRRRETPVKRRSVPRPNLLELFLAFSFAATLPINEFIARESEMPFSVIQLVSAFALLYCIVFRSQLFGRILVHPVFLCSYAFLGAISLMEMAEPHSEFKFIFALGKMVVVALAIATILRDRRALRAMAAGVLVAGVLFGISMLGQYGYLSSVFAVGFDQASRARAALEEQMAVYDNLNAVGFWLLQATLVALVIGTRARRVMVRWGFLGASVFFLISSFLPMSRSAVLISILTISYYLFRIHKVSFRTLMTATVLALAVFVIVPPVVFARMHFNIFAPQLQQEGRSYVYRAVLEEFPRYALRGVGYGNFWKAWGPRSLFSKGGSVIGPHNGPAAVLIFWGMPAFTVLFLVFLALYRRVKALGNSLEETLVATFAVGGLGLFLVVHNFYNKEFSFLIALPVAAHYWGIQLGTMGPGMRKGPPHQYPGSRTGGHGIGSPRWNPAAQPPGGQVPRPSRVFLQRGLGSEE